MGTEEGTGVRGNRKAELAVGGQGRGREKER